MTTLIGARWKRSNACSRGVLIPRQNSRKELWESRPIHFSFLKNVYGSYGVPALPGRGRIIVFFDLLILFLCRSSFSTGRSLNILCWWFGDGGTPVLIPNTAVKPICADGSRKARVGRRQHRVFKKEAARDLWSRAALGCRM